MPKCSLCVNLAGYRRSRWKRWHDGLPFGAWLFAGITVPGVYTPGSLAIDGRPFGGKLCGVPNTPMK